MAHNLDSLLIIHWLKSIIMKKNIIGALALAAVTVFSCDKNDDNDTDVNATDRNFTQVAAMSGFAEVDAGQLAAVKATNPGIKSFAQMMVAEHGANGSQLKMIATNLGLYAPDSLDAEHVALKAQLMSLNGRAFDSVYIHSQVSDHNKVISLFNDEQVNGNNGQLRGYADTTLPHLHQHLSSAQTLASQY
jgi:putative membrane protein